jgi:hypothetical protein
LKAGFSNNEAAGPNTRQLHTVLSIQMRETSAALAVTFIATAMNLHFYRNDSHYNF